MTLSGATGSRLSSRSRHTRLEQVWVEALLVVAVLVIATGLRFLSLGDRSFWADEAYSGFVASHGPREIITLTMRDDAHPPFYYLALSLWSRLVGTGDAGLRSLGAVVSIMTVGGTWWIGRQLKGPTTGVLAAVLTAVSPFQVLAAQEARMYVLLGFLTVLAWAAFLAALEGRRWAWGVYIVATTLALYTHYFAFLNLLGQGVFILATAPLRWRSWAVTQFVIFVLYLPWLGRFLATVTSARGWPFLRIPLEATSVTTLFGLLSFGGHTLGFGGWFGGASASLALQLTVLAPFLGLAVLGAAAVWKQPRPFWFIIGALIVPLGAAWAFSLRTNVIYPKYFSFLHAPYAILLAFGILFVASRVAWTHRRAVVLLLGLIVVLVSTPALRNLYFDPGFQVYNWRGAAAWLVAEAGPNDLIVITPGFNRIPLSRYFRGPQVILAIDPIEFSDPKRASTQPDAARDARTRALFQSYASSHDVLWIVTTAELPQPALVRLGTILEGIYDPQGAAYFNAITVFRAKHHGGVDVPLSSRRAMGGWFSLMFGEASVRRDCQPAGVCRTRERVGAQQVFIPTRRTPVPRDRERT